MESHSEQGDWSLVTCLVDIGDNQDGECEVGQGRGGSHSHRARVPSKEVQMCSCWHIITSHYGMQHRQLSPFTLYCKYSLSTKTTKFTVEYCQNFSHWESNDSPMSKAKEKQEKTLR